MDGALDGVMEGAANFVGVPEAPIANHGSQIVADGTGRIDLNRLHDT
jgi:hypothetical protein